MVVIEPGEELIRSLIAFARRQDIDAAVVAGIGAVSHVELGFYDPATGVYGRQAFDEPLEACAIHGNVALIDGEPHPHVHAVLGRADFTTIGGHLFEAVCSVTLELTVHTSPEAWERRDVEFCNLKLMQLEAPR